MATVDLPVVGTVDKKWVWIGGGGAAAVLAWAYYRRSQSGPTVIEEGIEGGIGADIGEGWGNRPGNTGNSNQDQDNEVIDTVAEWTADVVQKLAATDWDTGFVYATIGKWIAGEGLTPAEKSLVLAAIAASGQPPGGPYPIKTAQPTPTPTPDPPPPPPPPPPPQAPTHMSVPLEYDLYRWVDELNAQYPGLGLTFVRLVDVLNPGYRKYLRWDPTPGSPNKTPVFNRNWSGRNPPLGIAPARIR